MFLFFFALVAGAFAFTPLVDQTMVDDINKNVNSSFKAKLYPQFAALSLEEFRKSLPPVESIRLHNKRLGSNPTAPKRNVSYGALPAEFDAREQWYINAQIHADTQIDR
jgi:hypothetical protein